MIDFNKAIVVTGAAGFIGSHIVAKLNEAGYKRIIIVDDLTDGEKFKNLKGLQFSQYIDKESFLNWFRAEGAYYENPLMEISDFLGQDSDDDEDEEPEEIVSDIGCVIHMGACSDTREKDGKKMMNYNYSYAIDLLNLCQYENIPFIYASSASVYGNSKDSSEADPLNVYAFSKMSLDQYVYRFLEGSIKTKKDFSPIVGLRFFNVYGHNESIKYKKNQSSPVYKWIKELKVKDSPNHPVVTLYDVDSRRDFVFVEDVCSVVLWFMNQNHSGIFDVGTGENVSWRELLEMIIDNLKLKHYSTYTCTDPLPEDLKAQYQYFTKADLSSLRSVGYDKEFTPIEDGVKIMVGELS